MSNISHQKISDITNAFLSMAEDQTNMAEKIANLTFELSILSIEYETLTKKLNKEIDKIQKILAQLGGDEE